MSAPSSYTRNAASFSSVCSCFKSSPETTVCCEQAYTRTPSSIASGAVSGLTDATGCGGSGVGVGVAGVAGDVLRRRCSSFWVCAIWLSIIVMRAWSESIASWYDAVSYVMSRSPACTTAPSWTAMDCTSPSRRVMFSVLPSLTTPDISWLSP